MTWADLRGSALSLLQWTPQAFYLATVDEVIGAINAHRSESKQQSRDHWEQTRLLAMYLAQPYSKRINQPTDMWRFEDEQTEPLRVEEMDDATQKQIAAMDEYMARKFGKHHNKDK